MWEWPHLCELLASSGGSFLLHSSSITSRVLYNKEPNRGNCKKGEIKKFKFKSWEWILKQGKRYILKSGRIQMLKNNIYQSGSFRKSLQSDISQTHAQILAIHQFSFWKFKFDCWAFCPWRTDFFINIKTLRCFQY